MVIEKGLAQYFRSNLLKWAEHHGRSFPWRETADPYRVCVAEILLQQTRAPKVAEVYGHFIKRYPNVRSLSRARTEAIQRIISPLGFTYRAERLRAMANQVAKDYNCIYPGGMLGLTKLPGIGQYTASAILCFAYNEKVSVLDTNTIRLYSRFFGSPVKLPNSTPTKAIANIASSIIPGDRPKEYNYAALDFAAIVCKHYTPTCTQCPMCPKCQYHLTSSMTIN